MHKFSPSNEILTPEQALTIYRDWSGRAVPIVGARVGDVGERPTPVLKLNLSVRPDIRDQMRLHRQERMRDLNWAAPTFTKWFAVTLEGNYTYIFLQIVTEEPARCEIVLEFDPRAPEMLHWLDWVDHEGRIFLGDGTDRDDVDATGLLVYLKGEGAIDLLLRHKNISQSIKAGQVERGKQRNQKKGRR